MDRTLLASALALGLAFATGAQAAPAGAARDLSVLTRDVDRAESVRAVKDVQRTYAQYVQFGLWREAAALFAADGVADFGEGPEIRGRAAVTKALVEQSGKEGLKPGQFHTQLIEEPLVNLAPDGGHAQGRWYGFYLLADGAGAASLEGGVYENDYVREGGRWKIAALRFHPQYAGAYETGWTNWKNQPIGLTPYHFTADETGQPDLGASGPPPAATATPRALAQRVQAMVDTQKVRNLQNSYGYYVDRRMWDDVADLFAANGAVQVSGVGVYKGKAGVRRAMERMGPQSLSHGVLNDHLMFDTVVTVSPGGREAFARGFELGLIADGDQDTSRWEVTVFRNRFVKEGGLWKMREVRLFPHIRADYAVGWGKSHMVEAAPAAAAPDVSQPTQSAEQQEHLIPAFLGAAPIAAPAGYRLVATKPLTGPIAAPVKAAPAVTPAWLAEQRRKLAMATAYDGAESVQTAYGMYIDDFQWPQMGAIFGSRGAKEVPFAGYYLGGERITNAVIAEYGQPPTKPRAGISFHWLIQPVIIVAPDGRSASVRTRLFQPRTGLIPSTAEAASKSGLFLGAGIWEGMYQNQAYLENGTWRLWNLTLDEPFVESNGWKLGWAGMKDRPAGKLGPPNPVIQKYPPDILISVLGEREEHFRGGPGEQVAWPGILPMWFSYLNPVSGRKPEHFQPDCAPCEQAPDLKLTAHGYLLPPAGPTPD